MAAPVSVSPCSPNIVTKSQLCFFGAWNKFMVVVGGDLPSYTSPKFNIAPERWWLEDYFLIGKANFLGAMLNFRGVLRTNSPETNPRFMNRTRGSPALLYC